MTVPKQITLRELGSRLASLVAELPAKAVRVEIWVTVVVTVYPPVGDGSTPEVITLVYPFDEQ